MYNFINFIIEKWIQKAIKRPGRITELCGGKVTNDCLNKLEKKARKMMDSNDPQTKKEGRSLLSAVNLARRFRSKEFKHD